jgi:photoactive yellow protein
MNARKLGALLQRHRGEIRSAFARQKNCNRSDFVGRAASKSGLSARFCQANRPFVNNRGGHEQNGAGRVARRSARSQVYFVMRPNENSAESLSAAALAAMSQQSFDALAFGVIELDADFIVRGYNRPEYELARRKPEDTIGLPFFESVAPCTNNANFRGRIEALLDPENPAGEVSFDYAFTFSWGRRSVRIRALRGEKGGCWVFVTPLRSLDRNALDA